MTAATGPHGVGMLISEATVTHKLHEVLSVWGVA